MVRCWCRPAAAAPGVAVDRGRAGGVPLPVPAIDARGQLAGVSRGAVRLLPVRRRISSTPMSTATSATRRRGTCRSATTTARCRSTEIPASSSGAAYSVRGASHLLQSGVRHDRHRQPESVPGRISLQCRGEVRARLPGDANPRIAPRGKEQVGARGHGRHPDRHLRSVPAGLAGWTVAAYERNAQTVGQIEEAMGFLREWDGKMEADEAAPLLARLTVPASPQGDGGEGGPQCRPGLSDAMGPAVSNVYSGAARGLVRRLGPAVASGPRGCGRGGRRSQGEEIAKWQYGRSTSCASPAVVLSAIHYRPVHARRSTSAFSGSRHTVQQGNASWAVVADACSTPVTGTGSRRR